MLSPKCCQGRQLLEIVVVKDIGQWVDREIRKYSLKGEHVVLENTILIESQNESPIYTRKPEIKIS